MSQAAKKQPQKRPPLPLRNYPKNKLLHPVPFFSPEKRPPTDHVLPHNPPQLHHKSTTSNHPLFANPPCKNTNLTTNNFSFTAHLENLEVYLDIQLHQNRLPILHRGLEPVLSNRLDRLLIQSHPDTANHVHVAGIPIGIDPQIYQNIPGNLGLAGLLGKLRFNRVDQHRLRDTAANPTRAPAS